MKDNITSWAFTGCAPVSSRVVSACTEPKANIIVAGLTGAGKSTLTNAVTGRNDAITDMGMSQTDRTVLYESRNYPIRIWDTEGFVLDESGERTRQTFNEIKRVITDSAKDNDPLSNVHAIWYCINAENKRFQSAEADFVNELYGFGVPFTIVLTQCFSKNDNALFEQRIRQILSEKGIDSIPIVQLLAIPKEINAGDNIITVEAKGLSELVSLTIDNFPMYMNNCLKATQAVDRNIRLRNGVRIVESWVESVKNGFWDKIPVVNLFTTYSNIEGLFRRISEIYCTKLPDDVLSEIKDDYVNRWSTYTIEYLLRSSSYLRQTFSNVTALLDTYTEINAYSFTNSEKSALFIAVCGLDFLDALDYATYECDGEALVEVKDIAERIKQKIRSAYAYTG